MQLLIDRGGQVRCLYGETIPLQSLGKLTIGRASEVEPDQYGDWWVDLALSGGPVLGPFARRSQALEAEAKWLTDTASPAPIPPPTTIASPTIATIAHAKFNQGAIS